MVATVFLIIIGIWLLASVITWFRSEDDVQFGAFILACVALVCFVVLLIFSCTVIVGTRQTGIVTKWNRPTGETLNNGLHFVLPWTQVHEMDTAIQNDVFNGDKRISVRLGNNSTAQADANVRWQINPDQADELFVQYKTFDGVRSNLVERNLRTALNEAFTKFDPLSSDPAKNNLSNVVPDALNLLRAKAGNQVEIVDLSVPIIDYDDQTEQRINAINQARADTTRAEQETKTAEQKRKAAEQLASQPVPDLKIAIAACLNKMASDGVNLSCYPIGQGVVPTLAVPSPLG